MRSSRVVAVIGAVVMSLSTTLAVASPESGRSDDPGSTVDYRDVQLPPEIQTLPEASADVSFTDPTQNELAQDYASGVLTPAQFAALGLLDVAGALPSGSLPLTAAGAGSHVAGKAIRLQVSPAASGSPALSRLAGLSQQPADVTSGDAGDPTGTATTDNTEFLTYVFDVLKTAPAADQQQLMSAVSPVGPSDGDVGDGGGDDSGDVGGGHRSASLTQAHLATTAPTATTFAAAAAPAASRPSNPYCNHPKTSSVLNVINWVKRSLPILAPYPFPSNGQNVFDCEVKSFEFTIDYSLASNDPVNGVSTIDANHNQIPDYIDNMLRSLTEAYVTYARMGYSTPPPVTVFVSSFYGAMKAGNAFTPPPIGGRQYIVADNTGTEIYIPRHELFHAFQWRYIATMKLDTVNRFAKMNWWMEATAEWGAHQSLAASHTSLVSTTGRNERESYSGQLSTFLGQPSVSLDTWTGLGGTRQYGAFIFAEYLSGRFGRDAILHTWQHIGNENGHTHGAVDGTFPVTAIAETVSGYSSNLQTELPRFAEAAYQLGPNKAGSTPNRKFQYTDPDLNFWIARLKNVPMPAQDPDPADFRPSHSAYQLPAAGTAAMGPGGMYYTDLTWGGPAVECVYDVYGGSLSIDGTGGCPANYYPVYGAGGGGGAAPTTLQVTVQAPSSAELHATLVSWSAYRARCQPDHDVVVQPGKSATLAVTSLAGCSFATLILTIDQAYDTTSSSRQSFQWSAGSADSVSNN